MNKTRISEKFLRKWREEKLITSAGTRNILLQGETSTEGLPNEVVRNLDQSHLIRPSAVVSGRVFYELAYDRDKPTIFLHPPQNLKEYSSFMNIRVADIKVSYENWRRKGHHHHHHHHHHHSKVHRFLSSYNIIPVISSPGG